MDHSVTAYLTVLSALVTMSNTFDFSLKLSNAVVNPSLAADLRCIADSNGHENVLSRHRRYVYSEPETNLIKQFEKHLTATEGEESINLQEVVDNLVKECDRLSHKALNESIRRYADENYLVHYNHTETVYRFYRQRYQDFTESLYHKLIYVVPYLVKRHMRSVVANVTSDFKVLNIACMNRFQDLDERVNTHFLSYGELFRSILVESYNDIEKNFYAIFTNNPKITGGLCR